MELPDRPPEAMDAEIAARLERLAQRRAQSSPRPATPVSDAASTVPTGPSPRRRRRHAAKGARAVALGLSVASTGGLTTFFALSSVQPGQQTSAATVVSAAPASDTASLTAASRSTTTTAVADAPMPTQATASAVVDGATFRNRYGTVQVEAVFAPDGSLESVNVLQSPDGDSTSLRINNRAVPRLNDEAVTAQSAEVDTVSGATYTTIDYRSSLQSSIDAARAAGLTQLA